jgi:hypothetical protein
MLTATILSTTLQTEVVVKEKHSNVFSGMSHTMKTHNFRYVETDRKGQDVPYALETMEVNLVWCLVFSNCMGYFGYNFDPNQSSLSTEGYTQSINPPTGPQKPVVLFDAAAVVGLQKLGANVGAQHRPIQSDILTETVSGIRDGLVVAPCGSGKTILIYGFPIYCFAQKLGRITDDNERVNVLQQVLNQRAQNQEDILVAADLLADLDVQHLIEHAKGYPHDLCDKKRVSVVLAPTNSLADGLASDLNKCHLIRARRWQRDNADDVVGRINEGKLAEICEVLVATTAYATTKQNSEILSRLFRNDDAF